MKLLLYSTFDANTNMRSTYSTFSFGVLSRISASATNTSSNPSPVSALILYTSQLTFFLKFLPHLSYKTDL